MENLIMTDSKGRIDEAKDKTVGGVKVC